MCQAGNSDCKNGLERKSRLNCQVMPRPDIIRLIQKQAGFFDGGRYKAAQSVKQHMVFLSESVMKSEIGVHVNSTADL
jgi:hypothetical protein